MSDATATAEGLVCPECGADETASAQPFDEGRLNRHISAAHPDLWESIKDDQAIAPQTRAKASGRRPNNAKPPQPPRPAPTAKGRVDLTPNLIANIAAVGMLVGFRSPWKGQCLTSFAPKLGTDLNASAQEGPDWMYQALQMMSVGGPHMMLVFDLVALVVAFQSERSPRAQAMVPAMRAMNMPIPAGEWEKGQHRAPEPARPAPGPVTVDLQPDTPPASPSPAGATPSRPGPEEGSSAPAAAEGGVAHDIPGMAGFNLEEARAALEGQFGSGLAAMIDDQALAQAAEMAAAMLNGDNKPKP